jgi:YD repeat-containing protein
MRCCRSERLTDTYAAPTAQLSGVESYVYDAENRLVSRTADGVTTTYTYDGKGNLVKKSSSDGSWTVYVGGIYEKRNDGGYVTYYSAFGRRIAMRVHPPEGGPGTVHFLLADHLGSTSTVLSAATGDIEESAKYYPFGAPRDGDISLTDKKFPGQQNEGAPSGCTTTAPLLQQRDGAVPLARPRERFSR